MVIESFVRVHHLSIKAVMYGVTLWVKRFPVKREGILPEIATISTAKWLHTRFKRQSLGRYSKKWYPTGHRLSCCPFRWL